MSETSKVETEYEASRRITLELHSERRERATASKIPKRNLRGAG